MAQYFSSLTENLNSCSLIKKEKEVIKPFRTRLLCDLSILLAFLSSQALKWGGQVLTRVVVFIT